jgi:hypothetical protein
MKALVPVAAVVALGVGKLELMVFVVAVVVMDGVQLILFVETVAAFASFAVVLTSASNAAVAAVDQVDRSLRADTQTGQEYWLQNQTLDSTLAVAAVVAQ